MASVSRKRTYEEQTVGNLPTTNWFDLPSELRAMIIDMMGAKTRCRFAMCSKLCEKEAKESKMYLRGITLKRDKIVVNHSNFHNYSLEFIEIDNLTVPQTFVIYKTTSKFVSCSWARMTPRVIKWTKQETGTADDVRIRYLNRFFTDCKRSISDITIEDSDFPFDRFNVQHMHHFTNIIDEENDILDKRFVSITQLLRSDFVDLQETKMSFDQIVQFEGIDLIVRCNEFDKECIKKYLKMWNNGELNEKLESFNVYVESNRPNVTVEEITQGLDYFDYKSRTDDEVMFKFKFIANHQKNTAYHSRVICSFTSYMRLFQFEVYTSKKQPIPNSNPDDDSEDERSEFEFVLSDSDA